MYDKFLLPFSILLCFSISINSQCPEQWIKISSQEELNNFKSDYPDCKNLNVQMRISGHCITDLSPLEELESMVKLEIKDCDDLFIADIKSNIHIHDLSIINCPKLESARIINKVSNAGNLLLEDLPKLSIHEPYQLSVLNRLSLLNLRIPSLKKFPVLDSIKILLTIKDNPKLEDISNLENVQINSVSIRDNPLLESCNIPTFCNIISTNINQIDIRDNGASCHYLQQIITFCNPDTAICYLNSLNLADQRDIDFISTYPEECIDQIDIIHINIKDPHEEIELSPLLVFKDLRHLSIKNANQLINLHGLDSIQRLGTLHLNSLENFQSLEGLNKTALIKSLRIENTPSLLNIETGSLNLDSIWTIIIERTPISDLSVLNQVDSLWAIRLIDTKLVDLNDIKPTFQATFITVKDNKELEDCNAEMLCNNFHNDATLTIEGNLGCTSFFEISQLCTVSTKDPHKNEFRIFPNPTTGYLNIVAPDSESIKMISIYDHTGKFISEVLPSKTLDLSRLNNGIYYLKLITDDSFETIRFSKI